MPMQIYYYVVFRKDEWYFLMFLFLTGALYQRIWIGFCFIYLFSHDIKTVTYINGVL